MTTTTNKSEERKETYKNFTLTKKAHFVKMQLQKKKFKEMLPLEYLMKAFNIKSTKTFYKICKELCDKQYFNHLLIIDRYTNKNLHLFVPSKKYLHDKIASIEENDRYIVKSINGLSKKYSHDKIASTKQSDILKSINDTEKHQKVKSKVKSEVKSNLPGDAIQDKSIEIPNTTYYKNNNIVTNMHNIDNINNQNQIDDSNVLSDAAIFEILKEYLHILSGNALKLLALICKNPSQSHKELLKGLNWKSLNTLKKYIKELEDANIAKYYHGNGKEKSKFELMIDFESSTYRSQAKPVTIEDTSQPETENDYEEIRALQPAQIEVYREGELVHLMNEINFNGIPSFIGYIREHLNENEIDAVLSEDVKKKIFRAKNPAGRFREIVKNTTGELDDIMRSIETKRKARAKREKDESWLDEIDAKSKEDTQAFFKQFEHDDSFDMSVFRQLKNGGMLQPQPQGG